MENPIFTLTHVVKAKGEMEDFVGPLALILQLLSKNKIEIKDISISLILEQYLAYLDTLTAMDLEVAFTRARKHDAGGCVGAACPRPVGDHVSPSR